MRQFIIGVRPHNIFGYTVSAYWAEPVDSGILRVVQNILMQDIKATPQAFSPEQKEIIRLTEEISDKSIYKRFVHRRNISFREFYNNLNDKMLDQFILPYIGDRISKIFRLAHWSNTKIYLKSYRYDKIYEEDQLFYSFEPAEPVFIFEKQEDSLRYKLEILYKGRPLKLFGQNPEFLILEPCHFILDRRIYHCDNINCKKIKPFLDKEYITVRSKLDEYFEKFVRNIILNYKVIAKGFDIIEINPQKKAILTLEQNPSKQWGFTLQFFYDVFSFYPESKQERIVHLIKEQNRYKFIKFSRDLSWEENIIYALKAAGLRKGSNFGFFYFPHDSKNPEAQLQRTINWLNENYALIENLQIQVEQKTDRKFYTKQIDLNFQIQRKIDWFDIYATIKFGEYEIPFLELRDHILEGKREFTLPNGQIVIIPQQWFAKYKKLLLFAKKDKNKNRLKLTKAHFTVLEQLDSEAIKYTDIPKLIQVFKERKWQIASTPKTIKAKLRNYQKQGVGWIYTLHKYGFGGCLADDMGLGKTLQTITAIAKALEDYKKEHKLQTETQTPQHQLSLFSSNGKKPISLIIVPKSLIHNWLNEFRKFAPSYKVLAYAGTYRTRLREKFFNYDFIVTSYGVVRNDIDFLRQFNFFYVVLDESQYIKNPNSKIYQAVRRLNAQHKLLLTGTPIENSLTDLWTQMNFINPGLLGSYSFFKQHFITPIERQNNPQIKQELKDLIWPFILRRTKQEVVKDLPELTEQIVFCDMTEDQQLLYENEKAKIRNEILRIYQNGKLKETSIFILRALTRLRQIANHPKIVEPEKNWSSGKFDIVTQKIETVLEEGHKLLIFSSFVKHLELYEQYIKSKGWKYAMLTGETENRKQIIDYFQNDQDVKIFLISLKAGGVGLNLTAADYVFILDPWWNPAAEQQAISRAHRIGQNKNVFVYRFISLNTVEEKILHLQEKKRQLFKDFVDSANLFAQLSEENIVELFT